MTVGADFENAVRSVIGEFLNEGIKTLGCWRGRKRRRITKSCRTCAATFESDLRQRGLFHEEFMLTGDYTSMSGYQAMKQAIDRLEPLTHGFYRQ